MLPIKAINEAIERERIVKLERKYNDILNNLEGFFNRLLPAKNYLDEVYQRLETVLKTTQQNEQSIDVPERIKTELVRIASHTLVESVRIINGIRYDKNTIYNGEPALLIVTKPLVYTTKSDITAKIGRYVIAIPIASTQLPRFATLDMIADRQYCSPCCYTGNKPCFGTIESEIIKLQNEYNYGAIAFLMLSFIQSANPGTPYLGENAFIQGRAIKVAKTHPLEHFLFIEFWKKSVTILENDFDPEVKAKLPAPECPHIANGQDVCCDDCGSCDCFFCDYHERAENSEGDCYCFECDRCGHMKDFDDRMCDCRFCDGCDTDGYDRNECSDCNRCNDCEGSDNWCANCERGTKPETT